MWSRPWLTCVAGVSLLAAACTPSEPRPEPPSASDASAAAAPPAPSQAGEGTLHPIGRRQDVPLDGPRVDARPGDWLLENGGLAAVVDARAGRIVDFGAAGGDDALVGIEPAVYLGLEDVRSDVVSVAPAPGAPLVLRIERRVHDAPLRLWTFVSFAGTAVRIESVATSTGDASPAVTIGEKVGWGNVPTWVEGSGFIVKGGAFTGDFLAREGLGQAYAMGRPDGRMVARFNAPQAGFHERAHTGEDAVRVAAGGTSPRRVVLLAHATGSIGDAVVELLRDEGVALDPVALPGVSAERAVAEIVGCKAAEDPDGAPFARFALGKSPRAGATPRGCFRMRATAPGYAAGAWTSTRDPDAGQPGMEPRAGRLRWHVSERGGASLPARLAVRGIAPTRDPDWGDEPHDGAALEAIHTLGDGSMPIPPGRYRVTVSRGFEYTTSEQTVAVDEGRTATVDATLERVVDTRGWISADLHVHAVPSPDAPTLLDDRVRSLAASGVEVAAATDHNTITDYAPDDPGSRSAAVAGVDRRRRGDDPRASSSGTSTSSRSLRASRPSPSRTSRRARSSRPRAPRPRVTETGSSRSTTRAWDRSDTSSSSTSIRRISTDGAVALPSSTLPSTPSRSSTATTTPSADTSRHACAIGTRS